MSERIYARLLLLYPKSFREAYSEDALQLFRDRLHDETGSVRRARLWLDIIFDLTTSLARLYLGSSGQIIMAYAGEASPGPVLFVFEPTAMNPATIMCAFALASITFCVIPALIGPITPLDTSQTVSFATPSVPMDSAYTAASGLSLAAGPLLQGASIMPEPQMIRASSNCSLPIFEPARNAAHSLPIRRKIMHAHFKTSRIHILIRRVRQEHIQPALRVAVLKAENCSFR